MRPVDFAIRRMTDGDLRAVAEIEAGVFTDWCRTHRRDSRPLPERTIEELRHATSIDPGGNFVAVSAEGALVGFILSRTWGRVGWFGTFGVPTQFQGLGIGRALVQQTVGYLRGRASIIGLETMPESGTNIGLYSRAGFVVGYPTLILDLSLVQEADRLRGKRADDVVEWGAQDAGMRKRFLGEIRGISDAVLAGLDYSPEVAAIEAHGFGKTFLSLGAGSRVDGFAVLRTAPFRRHDTSGRAYIHILALKPGSDYEVILRNLLGQIWTAATRLGFSKVVTGLSARYQDAAGLFLASGFRVVRAAIRMVDRASPGEIFEPSDAINASRWAG